MGIRGIIQKKRGIVCYNQRIINVEPDGKILLTNGKVQTLLLKLL